MLTKAPPVLGFDFLNADFEMLDPFDQLLVAVSGGGDSIALLHLLVERLGADRLAVATVDHGLRAEAALEAEQVATLCKRLGVRHETLTWRVFTAATENPSKTSAREAREGRYDLLTRHAQSIGAGAIVLGHTLDDQAETVLMRALRMNDSSSTRGLAGMAATSSYGQTKLLRPLLKTPRQNLRDYLRAISESWIDDPSNEDTVNERVRVRMALQSRSRLPVMDQIARLADVSARSRRWINEQIAKAITTDVSWPKPDHIEIDLSAMPPPPVLTQMLCALLQIAGGQVFPVAERKIQDVVNAAIAGKRFRKTVGKCLIEIKGQSLILRPEHRGTDTKPTQFHGLSAQMAESRVHNAFQPDYDDALIEALQTCFSCPPSR